MKKISLLHLLCLLFIVGTSEASEMNYKAGEGPSEICGRHVENAVSLNEVIRAESGIKFLKEDQNFASFADEESGIIWVFTKKENFAHPAAICREIIEKDGQIVVHMEIRCDAEKLECDKLSQAFGKHDAAVVEKSRQEMNENKE